MAVVFWSPEIVVDERGAFQVTLSAPSNVAMSLMPIASMELIFSGEERSIRVNHTEDVGAELESVRRIDLGHIDLHGKGEDADANDIPAYLRWRPGDAVVFCGTISSNVPCALTVRYLFQWQSQPGCWNEGSIICRSQNSS